MQGFISTAINKKQVLIMIETTHFISTQYNSCRYQSKTRVEDILNIDFACSDKTQDLSTHGNTLETSLNCWTLDQMNGEQLDTKCYAIVCLFC